MSRNTEADLAAQIKAAFGHVQPPPREEMLQPVYAGNEDVYEMMMAFLGKHWTEVPMIDLFRHRESIFALSALGYRAYLPAYLMASLTRDERYGSDIWGYMLDGLMAWPDSSELRKTTTRERLSLLDEPQRAAVAGVLRYLVDEWSSSEAAEVLREWESEAREDEIHD